ncbi:HAMP domain-containing sensor histidine kinase [Rhizobacter sp. Root404]|uniref:hybrid sensor histidine kinase/response regulator n=1 Tax=Rhizobacter sp. Root404 TaxID=1736528 RepID=UPI0006F20CA6|nr:HAMP domain-containing sensor histidine kinase [Rhizobacter sp. Root404]KQW38017.1 two-component system sensor histidine kinase/response regulator [Rhizobacter sp. Root404]
MTTAVKCLIVDDVAENLVALSALLRAEDVEVLQARSAVEALELLLVHDVALALLDVQMPEIDGFELAEMMRGSERTRRIPIIFVTAGARDQQRMFKGYESGAVDFLFKPIESHVLKSKASVFFRLHRQNMQLEAQLDSLRETLRLNEMFTAVLGHDLRGPLTAMSISAQALARGPDESVRKLSARMVHSCKWMGRMIEDLLDLSRARVGGGITIVRQAVDLGDIAEKAAQERRVMFPNRELAVRRSGDTHGRWDGDRISQVMANLLGNALIHGRPDCTIEVRVDGSRPDAVNLSVTNEGAVPEDILPHIFDPFRSGRTGSERADGLGLGLYIVDQIVRAHGGRIDVAVDAATDSTRFSVELPRDAQSR